VLHNVSRPFLKQLPLQLWGGIECTINRVGDTYRHQLEETGHIARLEDLDLLAALGCAAIRYPVLWEQVAPDDPSVRDWCWHDARLARLNADGQRIIAGLVHHGSGPHYTNLLDPGFAAGLAVHAHAVAERYPFIRDWTPVNEPVTTARFSALYGHWYPHSRDERAFWLALLNQVDATRLAMRAVRQVNPEARLIQTDDLGRTYATAALRDQAGFDNVRRWMGWDLLCGMVDAKHDLWARLCDFGFQSRLQAIADDPCPPDIIGINHYLTSDRFLDHRRQLYPGARKEALPPGYVDLEAVRVLDPAPPGLAGSIREAWERYGLPIAVTEVHNGSTREEQMRWMASAWDTAQAARAAGIDVSAVTSWALFGSQGWDTLLTGGGRYEAGAFHTGDGTARPTAVVPLLHALGQDSRPDHPVLDGAGWWNRPIRLHHRAVPRTAPMAEHADRSGQPFLEKTAPVLIAGGNGTLGQALAAACRHRGIAHVALGRDQLNLLDDASVAGALDRFRPWLVINAAGWVRVDDAEDEEAACNAINAGGAARLATACGARDIQSMHLSSDLVFAGRHGHAFVESDRSAPLNAYGRSKAAAEDAVAALPGRHLMVRTAAFFSPFDRYNFAIQTCDALARGDVVQAAGTYVVTPTYVPDLCDAMLDLAIDGEQGLWHLTNAEACSWADFARRLAQACGFDSASVVAFEGADPAWRAARPLHAPLATMRGRLLPALSDAIARFARDRPGTPTPQTAALPLYEEHASL
jgi:dTDP-4-dehydrorhamnose reductase